MEEQQIEHKTYAGRYYVLIVLSFLCALQNIAWITFSPIVEEAKLSYGLTDIEITLLPGELVFNDDSQVTPRCSLNIDMM